MSHKTTAPHGHHHAGKSSERFLDKEIILRELTISPGDIILDAGCGNGYMTKEFAQRIKTSGKIYAVDADAKAIEVLREQVKGDNITPILGDVTEGTDIPAASVDLIYLATVWHGFSEVEKDGFRREVKRLLKTGGRLAIVEIKKEPTPFGPPLAIRSSPQDLQEQFSLLPTKTVELGQFFYMQIFQNKI